MNYPDLDNLLRLLDERDAAAVPPGMPTCFGAGRGELTTDDVRAALLSQRLHDGIAS